MCRKSEYTAITGLKIVQKLPNMAENHAKRISTQDQQVLPSKNTGFLRVSSLKQIELGIVRVGYCVDLPCHGDGGLAGEERFLGDVVDDMPTAPDAQA